MTKVPVNVPNLMANTAYKTSKVQDTDTKGDFSKILENQKSITSEEKVQDSKLSDETVDTQETVRNDIKDDSVQEVTDASGSDKVKETADTQNTQNSTADDSTDSELTEEEMNAVMPMLLNAAADVKALLVQELGISGDELNTLMERMGMTAADLLDKGNLRELILQAEGVTDMTALLTDEALYQQIQSLENGFEEIMENVQETLQLTDEEMNAFKEQISELGKAEGISSLGDGAEEMLKVEGAESAGEDETAAGEGNGNAGQNANSAFVSLNQNGFSTQNNTAVHTQMAQNATFASTVENEQIMQQVVDYMKIQLNADTSTLEMQLHPESMGTLNIRILEKEGVMTAQFTTTSETVKAALEGQMIQLLQQFEDQNIKVEAIEVAVSTSQQFENALKQGDEQQQAQNERRGRARRINLSDLNGLANSEEYSEEDRVVVEMMAANGNTVDYLA